MDEGKVVSCWPTTRPAPYDANAKPRKEARPLARVAAAQVGGFAGGTARDAGAATQGDGVRQVKQKQAQAAKENKY